MGVRVVFPDMGKDPSVQLIEKTITENGTYDAITDGANGYSKVNVNVEGGGGSSDFSTAEVTIRTEDSVLETVLVYLANITEAPVPGIPSFSRGNGEPGEPMRAILYKGVAKATIGIDGGSISDYSFTTSGNVQDMGGGIFDITGDCTITIS